MIHRHPRTPRRDLYAAAAAVLLDPPLHEFLPSLEEATDDRMRERIRALHEANPMLGTRGCRLGLMYPEIYEMQVRAIVRAAIARQVVEFHGQEYEIPYSGEDATGLGKPLKLMMHPHRSEIPIYLAAIGPKNVALAFEIADGWIPVWVSPEKMETPEPKPGFDIAAFAVPDEPRFEYQGPINRPWGSRYLFFTDPNGLSVVVFSGTSL